MTETTTTTTPAKGARKKTGTGAGSIASEIKGIIGSGGVGFSGGTGTTSNTPGVSNKLAGDIVPFSAPHQLPWFNPTSGTLSTAADGSTTTTYANWVAMIHEIKDNPTLIERIQRSLKQAGLLPATWANYGVLDKATTSAWEQLGQSAIGGTESATALLNAGMNEGDLGTVTKAIQDKINSAQAQADAVSSVNVSLTDPNQIAQAFASAMEDVGLGAPSKAQVAKFVGAFHNAEVSAAQNQSEVQKQNYLAGAGDLSTALHDATLGNVSGAQAAESATGPTFVATKAMPNLDAEAMAAAKNSDPAQYYATMASYVGNTIHSMLGGDLTGQSTPTAPSQTAPGGAVLTAPMGSM